MSASVRPAGRSVPLSKSRLIALFLDLADEYERSAETLRGIAAERHKWTARMLYAFLFVTGHKSQVMSAIRRARTQA